MSQLALYRKYRPLDLNEMVGQPHVTTSLENSLASGRFSHAYLFTGPRGVGKTSTARILARRINKLKPEESTTHLDIIEIDAASNRRIDEIRELRDKIHIAPSVGEYKVYIIDEVHMLTQEAFNALLKTLEEPPAHAVFVLATTEPHKLPETIISRTQRYSFRLVKPDVLADYLLKVAKQESLKLETAAAGLIARSSQGSVRDALSLLDQAANLSDQPITETAIADMLGLANVSTVNEILQHMLEQNSQAVLALLSKYRQQGGSYRQLLDQLLGSLHLVLQNLLGSSTASQRNELTAAAQNTGVKQVVTTINRLAQLPYASPYLDIALEAAMVELAEPVVKQATTPKTAPAQQPIQGKAKPPPKSKSTVSPQTAVTTSDSSWAKVLTKIKQQNNSLYALLRSATVDINGQTVQIQFRFQFHMRRLEEARNKQLLEQTVRDTYGDNVALETVLAAAQATPADTKEETKENKQAVDSVLQILGGEVLGG